jgi:hypothetical protein
MRLPRIRHARHVSLPPYSSGKEDWTAELEAGVCLSPTLRK